VRKAITNDKVVSLTFDDWGTDYTVTKVLDILRQYGIPATFFVRVNGVKNNPNLARSILREGHDVGNHTFSHPEITTLTPEQLQEEVVKAHRILTEALQQQPTMLFRPPKRVIDETSARIVAATGYSTIVNYDVTTFDWDTSHSPDDIFQTIEEKTTPGSIILLHILDDLPSLEALPRIIEYLLGQGYTFIKVSELIEKYPIELEMQQ
jgi:peptidoglycan/xylan/chitin deacetylase (PgdA/CDA1 family)